MPNIVSNILIYHSFFGSNNNTQEKENESIERGSNSGLKAHNLIPGLNNNSQSGMHQSSLFNQTSSKFVPQTSKEDNSPSANEYTEQKNDNQKDYMKEIMNKIEMMKMDKNEEASPKSSPKQKESSDSTNNYQQPIYQDFNYNIQFPYNQMSIHQKKIQPNQIEADLIENCATLCKEQAGCRLLQKKIDETPSIASDIIYNWYSTSIADVYFANRSCHILRPIDIPHELECKIFENGKFIRTEEDFLKSMHSPESSFPIPLENISFAYSNDQYLSYLRIADECEKVIKEDTVYFKSNIKKKIRK